MPTITERYASYTSPRWLVPSVQCLLSTVPPRHLQSLSEVVLTNSMSIGPGKTGRVRGRKHARDSCRGFYHRARDRAPAWLELVVDNTFRGIPPSVLSFSAVREVVLGDVLYHELGHHFDLTVGAPARTGEKAADSWSVRLLRQHVRQRHRFLRSLLALAVPVIRFEAKRRANRS